MEKKILGITLFLILLIYHILWRIFYKFIPSNLNYLVWGIWIVLVIIFIYWLSKKTNFFKKQDSLKSTAEHRMSVLEQSGFYSTIIPLGYILGLICLGIGFFALFSDNPDGLNIFIGMLILGLIGISIMFFIGKLRKKNQK